MPAGTPRALIKKVDATIMVIQNGGHLRQYRRLWWDRSHVAVPVGYRYRLMVDASQTSWIPIEVFSHEEYTGIVINNVIVVR